MADDGVIAPLWMESGLQVLVQGLWTSPRNTCLRLSRQGIHLWHRTGLVPLEARGAVHFAAMQRLLAGFECHAGVACSPTPNHA